MGEDATITKCRLVVHLVDGTAVEGEWTSTEGLIEWEDSLADLVASSAGWQINFGLPGDAGWVAIPKQSVLYIEVQTSPLESEPTDG